MPRSLYGPYRPVYSGNVPPHLENELPNDRPVQSFRYSKELIFDISLSDFILEGTNVKDIEGYWEFELRESPDDSAPIIFKQRVDWTAQVIAFVDPVFGSIGFVTWSPSLNNGFGEISTTYANGTEIDPAHGYLYLDETNPQPGTEEGFTDFVPEGVATVGGYSFHARWFSPNYKLSLASPAYLKRTADQWSAGFIASGSFAFSFREGAPRLLSTSFDAFGALLHASGPNAQDTIFTGRRWPGYAHSDAGSAFPDSTDPEIFELPDGREILGVMQNDGYFEYVSRNSEWTWQKVKYPDPDNLLETAARAVWSTEFEMPLLVAVDEARVSVAKFGSDLYARRITDEGVSEQVRVGGAHADESYSIAADETGVLYISDTSGVKFVSHDTGVKWKPYVTESV